MIPTVAILFTGGTISMRIDARSGSAVPAMRGDDILAHVPQLGDVADIELEDVSQLPGPHVTPEHMWRLSRRVAAWLEEQLAVADELVIKDPRASWFLGLWRAAAERNDATVSYVTMLRPVTEVVGSKQTYYGRMGAGSDQGAVTRTAAWINMMLHTERATRGQQRAFVCKAQMVRRMPRRRNGRDRLAVDRNALTVGQDAIGRIIAVERGIRARSDGLQ